MRRWMRRVRASAAGTAARQHHRVASPHVPDVLRLNEKPFAITPDPRYLYLSERHGEALAHLLYGINEAGGFVQLTGEVGTGKTTIVRSLLAQTRRTRRSRSFSSQDDRAGIPAHICEELGIGVQDSAPGSLKDWSTSSATTCCAPMPRVSASYCGGRGAELSPDVLEQVRLLTNSKPTRRNSCRSFSSPAELRELLSRNELRQLHSASRPLSLESAVARRDHATCATGCGSRARPRHLRGRGAE